MDSREDAKKTLVALDMLANSESWKWYVETYLKPWLAHAEQIAVGAEHSVPLARAFGAAKQLRTVIEYPEAQIEALKRFLEMPSEQ